MLSTRLLKITVLCAIAFSNSIATTEAEVYSLTPQEKKAIDDCKKVIKAADDSINKAQQTIKDQNDIIKFKGDAITELVKQNVELRTERDSIWHNPIFWFVVGVGIGGITYGAIQATH